MSARRDSKGRVLRTGESQRVDGRYLYKYVDINGKIKYAYSWKLNSTDKVPAGVSDCKSLREIEREIRRDMEDEIDTVASNESLNQRFEKYMKSKKGLAATTKSGYYDTYRLHCAEQLGHRPIKSIRYTDIKERYIEMITEDGLQPTSISCLQTILHPVFQEAVNDNIIRSNPTDGVVARIKDEYKDVFDIEPRHALTEIEQATLLNYTRESKMFCRWYPVIVALIGTGMRSEELFALTWDDVDFEKKQIKVDRVIISRGLVDDYKKSKHETKMMISNKMKNEYSRRTIPLSEKVAEALKLQKEFCQIRPCRFEVDGYTDFIFNTRYNRPLRGANINRALKTIVENYNKEETEKAEKENREAVLLPHITCHMFRHTFATRLRESNVNRDVIQKLMGHKEGGETLDIYVEMQEFRLMQEQNTLDSNLGLVDA